MTDPRIVVGSLGALLTGVETPIGLILDEVEIAGEGLEVDGEPFALRLPQPASLRVRVGEASLARFLDGKAPGGLKNFRVSLAEDEVRVKATATVLFPIEVAATCVLRIEEGRRLCVDLKRMDSVGGAGIAAIVQRQLAAINPVFDAASLPFPVEIRTVEIAGGFLDLKGVVSPPSA